MNLAPNTSVDDSTMSHCQKVGHTSKWLRDVSSPRAWENIREEKLRKLLLITHDKKKSIFKYFKDICCPGVVTQLEKWQQGKKPVLHPLHQDPLEFLSCEQGKVCQQHFFLSQNERMKVEVRCSSICTVIKRPKHGPLFLINRLRGKWTLWNTGVGVSLKVSHGYRYHGNNFLLWGFQRSGAWLQSQFKGEQR